MIIEAIACVAQMDINLGQLLAKLLKADASVGMSMYFELSGSEARKAALKGAAKKALRPEDNKLLDKVMRAIKPARDRRNDFAHGVWGISEELPDALLWTNPDDYIAHDLVYKEWVRSLKPGDLVTETERVPMHSPRVQVYRQNDLHGDLEEAREVGNCAYYLRLALDPDARLASAPDDPQAHGAQMRQTLARSPLLQRLIPIQR
jgi:hypothetical protein